MATSLDLARTYTSYSGVDIRVIINGAQVGSMQALSYAIQREKAPIYVMGSVDPVSYSRGKRGIAGTMISLMMDTHILMSPSFTGEYYLGDSDEVFATTTTETGSRAADTSALGNVDNEVNSPVSLTTLGGISGLSGPGHSTPFGSTLTSYDGALGQGGANATGAFQRVSQQNSYNTAEVANNYKVAPVFYVDQILPFDIAIVAANEYGQSAQMRLYGCEILNEGSGFSIDDIVIENQMTYVCRTILPWRSFDLKTTVHGGEQSSIQSAREALYGRLGNAENRGASTGGSNQTVKYGSSTGTLS